MQITKWYRRSANRDNWRPKCCLATLLHSNRSREKQISFRLIESRKVRRIQIPITNGREGQCGMWRDTRYIKIRTKYLFSLCNCCSRCSPMNSANALFDYFMKTSCLPCVCARSFKQKLLLPKMRTRAFGQRRRLKGEWETQIHTERSPNNTQVSEQKRMRHRICIYLQVVAIA